MEWIALSFLVSNMCIVNDEYNTGLDLDTVYHVCHVLIVIGGLIVIIVITGILAGVLYIIFCRKKAKGKSYVDTKI